MSYRAKSRNRVIRRNIRKLTNIIKLNGFDLTLPYKFILIGFAITTCSLFLPWIDSKNAEIQGNAFNEILGISGYITLLILILILCFVLFKNTQEKIKSVLNLIIKDGNIIIFLFLFCLILSTNNVFLINGLITFKESLLVGIGIVWSIVGEIFGIVGGYILLKEKAKINVTIEDKDTENLDYILKGSFQADKNNMKLPF